MVQSTSLLDVVRGVVRRGARQLAGLLNRLSGGTITPTSVTLTGLLAHLPIAWLIAQSHYAIAAVLLVVFGLLDTLDGELARLQNRASNGGMLLDASTDRMKEILLYTAAAYALSRTGYPLQAFWAVAACGGSLLVSYVKAKGETAVASHHQSHHDTNYLFADGLMRFEVRMFVLVVGLLSGYLLAALIVIALAAWGTALARLSRIFRYLQNV